MCYFLPSIRMMEAAMHKALKQAVRSKEKVNSMREFYLNFDCIQF